jgi:hypothetical protein
MYGGVEEQLQPILNLILEGGEWSESRHDRFTPVEGAHCADWIGNWMGPTAGLYLVGKRKFPAPTGNQTPVVEPVA